MAINRNRRSSLERRCVSKSTKRLFKDAVNRSSEIGGVVHLSESFIEDGINQVCFRFLSLRFTMEQPERCQCNLFVLPLVESFLRKNVEDRSY